MQDRIRKGLYGLYGLAGLLLASTVLPLGDWLGLAKWDTLVTYVILPAIALLSLPLAISQRSVRLILIGLVFLLSGFLMASLQLVFVTLF